MVPELISNRAIEGAAIEWAMSLERAVEGASGCPVQPRSPLEEEVARLRSAADFNGSSQRTGAREQLTALRLVP
jgi:hypothetical protein